MRVCLVSRELAPFWGAGIGTYTAESARAWAAAGHETHILTPRHTGLMERAPAEFPDIQIHTIDPALSAEDLAPRPYEFQRYAMRVFRMLERLHADSHFDYIEFPDYWAEGHEAIRARRAQGALPGATLCVRLHTPTFECRSLNAEQDEDTETAALMREEDRAILEADLVLSPTRALADLIEQRLGRAADAVIPYPFFPLTVSPTHRLTVSSSHPSEVLYFGRLERRKGVHILIEAALRLIKEGSPAGFRFVGADTTSGGASFLAHLRTMIPAPLASRFAFDVPKPRHELPAIIRSAAASGGACCFPSLWENFPNACLEAMSLGCPVVASDAGGMAEIIRHSKDGLLFKSGSVADLAVALNRMLTDSALRSQISQSAPDRINGLCNANQVVAATLASIEQRTRHVPPRRAHLRIALVSREFAPFFGGGIGSYISQMCAVLAAAGHEVHVITAPHENLLKNAPYLRPGVRFHTVDLESGRAALDAYPCFPMRYSMAAHEKLAALNAQSPFDYVEFPDYHAEGYFAMHTKRTLGACPDSILAIRTHTPSWLCRRADRDERLTTEAATIEHMERSAIAEADAVISPSQMGLDRIASAPRPCDSLSHTPTLALIPCPIDPAELQRELGASPHPLIPSSPHQLPTVLFFGKLQFLKGPHDFIAAAVSLLSRGIQARFRLIGNDSPTGPFGRSMLDWLRSLIPAEHAAGGRITFEPAIPRNALGAAIRQAAESGGCCCFPSHWESFPNVCIEAMTLSCPVVGTDVAGMGLIIEHGRSGLLHPVGDSPALAAAIERLLTDTPLRERLANAGPDRVRSLCDPASILASLANLIERARSNVTIEPRPTLRRSTLGASPADPALTVIIPFYNLGRFLPDTIASLDRQTRRDFTTLIINDGSSEADSLALLRHLEATRPDLRIIHQPNRGLSATRNAGLRAAATRWVMPLDADDLIGPTLIQQAMAALERHPELSFVSPLVSYFTDDPDRPHGGWLPLGPDRDLLAIHNCNAAASGTVLDREAALAVGGYDEALTSYEDWDLWCRLVKSGRHGTVLPEFLLHYRVRPDSMFRTEATSRHAALHAYLLSRHPDLPADMSRVTRMLACSGDSRASAQALIAENFRYRVADRVNNALKRAGVQQALKGLTVRVLGRQTPSRPS